MQSVTQQNGTQRNARVVVLFRVVGATVDPLTTLHDDAEQVELECADGHIFGALESFLATAAILFRELAHGERHARAHHEQEPRHHEICDIMRCEAETNKKHRNRR